MWTFATADFILVDDFESYDDIDPLPGEPGVNRIFDKWIEGYDLARYPGTIDPDGVGAIYLALSTELVETERLPIVVTDDGYTKIDRQKGKRVRCATKWKDLGTYEDLLVERLIR